MKPFQHPDIFGLSISGLNQDEFMRWLKCAV